MSDTGYGRRFGAPSSGTNGAVLAISSYNPGVQANPGSTSTTHADADSTNLVWPAFAVPESGDVVLTCSIVADIAGACLLAASVRTAGGTIADTIQDVVYNGGSSVSQRVFLEFELTGLTPGQAIAAGTYRLGIARRLGASTARVIVGGTNGNKAIFKVVAAPFV